MTRRLVRDLCKEVCERLGLDPCDVVRLDFEPDVVHVHLLVKGTDGRPTRSSVSNQARTTVRKIYFYEEGTP